MSTSWSAQTVACRMGAHGFWFVVIFLMSVAASFGQSSPAPNPDHNQATPSATPTPAVSPNVPSPPQLTVNNPFAPDGVTSSGQYVTRDEVNKLLEKQAEQLRKDLGGNTVNTDEINKLIVNATAGSGSLNPDNLIGCMNGIPLYRAADGTLSLGDKEPDDIKKLRCEK